MNNLTSPIISTQQLAEIVDDENLVLIDASIPPVGGGQLPEARWPEVAIGKARRLDINAGFSDANAPYPHTMLSERAFEQAVRTLGINNNTKIVVYDDLGLFSAARAWWMFKAMGHDNVFVLDGGLPQWLKESRVTTQGLQHAPQGDFSASANETMFCDTDYVLSIIANSKIALLDARSPERFNGLAAEPRKGVRAGHIPSAINIHYASLYNNGVFKPTNELKAIFQQNASDKEQLVMTCGSGVTACILALAAQHCGYQNITVYDGSWSEWGSRAELPVE